MLMAVIESINIMTAEMFTKDIRGLITGTYIWCLDME